MQRALRVGVPAPVQAQAERALLDSHRHLRADRDGPHVKTLATLNVITAQAWQWFVALGWLAKATAGGRVKWNPGLEQLLKIEAQRIKLAEVLLVTPKARHDAGLPILPEDACDDATDVVARARAMAKAQEQEWARTQGNGDGDVRRGRCSKTWIA